MTVEIKAPITGNLWKIVKQVGDKVEEYDTVMILESMKMEVPVEAPQDGTIKEIIAKEGASVLEEEVLALME